MDKCMGRHLSSVQSPSLSRVNLAPPWPLRPRSRLDLGSSRDSIVRPIVRRPLHHRSSFTHAARHDLVFPKGLTDSSIPKELDHRFILYGRLACQRPMHLGHECLREGSHAMHESSVNSFLFRGAQFDRPWPISSLIDPCYDSILCP